MLAFPFFFGTECPYNQWEDTVAFGTTEWILHSFYSIEGKNLFADHGFISCIHSFAVLAFARLCSFTWNYTTQKSTEALLQFLVIDSYGFKVWSCGLLKFFVYLEVSPITLRSISARHNANFIMTYTWFSIDA